jgi:peptidoglycan/xylan/chitin deacetylase (PgdA/CDA1 family)
MRDVAPRVAGLLPGVACRSRRFDPNGRPLLYVTIDDGPDVEGTSKLLDALSKFEARATFFVVASRASHDIGLLRAMLEAGHAIGNHGWSHIDAWRTAGSVSDLERGQQWLEDALNRDVPDVRPPYGHMTPTIYRWARSRGRRIVLWDTMPGDYDASATALILGDRLIRRVRAGSIAVLHDGAPAQRAVDTLSRALPRLQDAGWRFVSL